jgi:hypothetical protein
MRLPQIWIQFLSEGFKNKLDVFISLSLFKAHKLK